jgi:hypothetical protein
MNISQLLGVVNLEYQYPVATQSLIDFELAFSRTSKPYFHMPVNRACDIHVTCCFPSIVRACRANISRINAVRPRTLISRSWARKHFAQILVEHIFQRFLLSRSQLRVKDDRTTIQRFHQVQRLLDLSVPMYVWGWSYAFVAELKCRCPDEFSHFNERFIERKV